jgi:hypothetical protein
VVTAGKDVLTIWRDLQTLACGREAKVLQQLQPPPELLVLLQRLFLALRQPLRQRLVAGNVVHLGAANTLQSCIEPAVDPNYFNAQLSNVRVSSMSCCHVATAAWPGGWGSESGPAMACARTLTPSGADTFIDIAGRYTPFASSPGYPRAA